MAQLLTLNNNKTRLLSGSGSRILIRPNINYITNGLVGWWKFDGDATDSSGNGNNGTLVGSPSYVSGRIGSAISLNGSSQYIDLGVYTLSPQLSGSSAITQSAWIKYNSLTGNNQDILFVSIGSTNFTGASIQLDSTGHLRIGGRSVKTDGFQNATAASVLSTNTWHFVTGVLDFPSQKIYGYVDGVKVIDQSATFSNSTYTPFGSATTPDMIGVDGNPVSNPLYFNGTIDDARIYNRALSVAEIQQIYNLQG